MRPIRLPTNATAIEKNAAAELQHWIEQITTARPDDHDGRYGPSVRLQTDASLGEEGYRIAVEGDDLVLAGGTGRGVINAVYALLEEDLGCRFYTNDSIRLPKGTTLSVRPVARIVCAEAATARSILQVCVRSRPGRFAIARIRPRAAVSEEFGGQSTTTACSYTRTPSCCRPTSTFRIIRITLRWTRRKAIRGAALPDASGRGQDCYRRRCSTGWRRIRHTEIVSVSKNDSPR